MPDARRLNVLERLEYLFGKDNVNILTRKGSIVTGYGRIDKRKVYFYGYDFTYKGGSLGFEESRDISEIMELASSEGKILISLIDSGGARIQEGIDALEGYGDIFNKMIHISGKIPQISLILGPASGGASITAALSDFVFMTKYNSYIFINGPRIVKRITGIDVSPQSLGGSDVHYKYSGIAHFIAENEYECMNLAKKLIDYLPSNCNERPPKKERFMYKEDKLNLAINKVMKSETYDIHDLIEALADEDTFLEIQAEYAKNIVIGFMRLNGYVIAVVASNRLFNKGRIDRKAADKISRFIYFCDAFNIPILTLVDTPGFVVGIEEEKNGLVRHIAGIINAYSISTVPKITLIIGKAYGGAYIAMGSGYLSNSVLYAWPDSEIGVMSAEEAYEILYAKHLNELDETHRKKFIANYTKSIISPERGLKEGFIKEIIDPMDTREMINKELQKLNANYHIKYHQ